jgi:hypothetical protein
MLSTYQRGLIKRVIGQLRPHEQLRFEKAVAGQLRGNDRPADAEVRSAIFVALESMGVCLGKSALAGR